MGQLPSGAHVNKSERPVHRLARRSTADQTAPNSVRGAASKTHSRKDEDPLSRKCGQGSDVSESEASALGELGSSGYRGRESETYSGSDLDHHPQIPGEYLDYLMRWMDCS